MSDKGTSEERNDHSQTNFLDSPTEQPLIQPPSDAGNTSEFPMYEFDLSDGSEKQSSSDRSVPGDPGSPPTDEEFPNRDHKNVNIAEQQLTPLLVAGASSMEKAMYLSQTQFDPDGSSNAATTFADAERNYEQIGGDEQARTRIGQQESAELDDVYPVESDPLLSLPPPPMSRPEQSGDDFTDSLLYPHDSASSAQNSYFDSRTDQSEKGHPEGGPEQGKQSIPDFESPPQDVPVLETLPQTQFQSRPRAFNDAVPYSYEYHDAASFPEEIEEWFHYAPEEFQILTLAANIFTHHWSNFLKTGETTPFVYDYPENLDEQEKEKPREWTLADDEEQVRFVDFILGRIGAGDESLSMGRLMDGMDKVDLAVDGLTMHDALFCLVYLMLGCWIETAQINVANAGPDKDSPIHSPIDPEDGIQHGERFWQAKYGKSIVHFEWIKSNTRLVLDCDGLEKVASVAYGALENDCTAFVPDASEERSQMRRKVWCALTLMYIFLEVIRVEEDSDIQSSHRDKVVALEPNLVTTLLTCIDSIRWKDFVDLPHNKLFLLTWKAILVSLGGLEDVAQLKRMFRDPLLDEFDQRGQPVITASPLDYHQFRGEIASKYPTFDPPPAIFPLDPDQRSILSPIQGPSQGRINIGSAEVSGSNIGASIMNQGVHIATPIPSPPPSPGQSGKGFKKQSYQTNQMFPMLYPMSEGHALEFPPDFQGVDNYALQKEWKGDVPLSILEGTQLFVKRMHAPRAMKQLWDEREKYLKFKRGWMGTEYFRSQRKKRSRKRHQGHRSDSRFEMGHEILEEADLIESLNNATRVNESMNDLGLDNDLEARQDGLEPGPRDLRPDGSFEHAESEKKSSRVERSGSGKNGHGSSSRLKMTERIYRENLCRWQSVIVVLLNVLHANANTPFNAPSPAMQALMFEGGSGLSRRDIESIDAIRGQEISTKAVSGILILLLKWFKLSHVLKFEYITQLLLDTNFLPLVLRIFYTQNIEQLVKERFELNDFNFFSFCRRGPQMSASDEDEGEDQGRRGKESELATSNDNSEAIADDDYDLDDACPPPIKLHRSMPDYAAMRSLQRSNEPISIFSWRSFFIFINFLRIMQKICKKKSHRTLLMVTYKSSQFLGKTLRIQQREMLLYTLKLFKCQVPFCGRKWRQANMGVITEVYLHCRPSLREDWLAGMDIDMEVNNAGPNEQALRALTQWYNVRKYPDEMGLDEEGRGKGNGYRSIEDGQDFFVRQLEKLRLERADGGPFQEHRRWAESVEEGPM